MDNSSMIDIKFSKLVPFTNREEDWDEWSFKLKAGVASVNQESQQIFDDIDSHPEESKINSTDISRLGLEPLSNKLYFALVMLTKTTATRIVKQVPNNNGFEAYWQKEAEKLETCAGKWAPCRISS